MLLKVDKIITGMTKCKSKSDFNLVIVGFTKEIILLLPFTCLWFFQKLEKTIWCSCVSYFGFDVGQDKTFFHHFQTGQILFCNLIIMPCGENLFFFVCLIFVM